jgi:hypothetical protein
MRGARILALAATEEDDASDMRNDRGVYIMVPLTVAGAWSIDADQAA